MLIYDEIINCNIAVVSNNIIRKTITNSTLDYVDYIKKIVNHFIDNPDDMVVPVYNFNLINSNYSYSYDMKRLYPLSLKEKDVIKFCSRYLNRQCTDIINETLSLYKGLYPELVEFVNEIIFQKRYWDLHSENILKDEFNQYKIIDLEGFNPIETWNRKKL